MPEEKQDDRLAKLYGTLAGLALSRSDLYEEVASPLGMLSELGERPYSPSARGIPLHIEDPRFAREAEQIRQHIKAPKIPIYVGEIDAVRHPALIRLGQKYPWLLPGVGDARPALTTRAPGGYAGIAHELGHSVPSPISTASILSQHPLLKMLGVGAGVSAALSESETAQSIAPFISTAPYIPELLEEARATAHGVRGVKAVKGNVEALKALARLTPAFMTYLAAALPALAAPYVAKGIKEHVKKKKAEKTAAAQPKATGRTIATARQQWSTPAPKPKTSKPLKPRADNPGTPPAKPPSKRKFWTDMQKGMEYFRTRKVI